jgi:cytochrome c-type biogenesis protein CcmH/NrfG
LRQSDLALRISPNNVNFWKTRTKIFYSFSAFDPQFNTAAIQALEKALALSVNDPKIIYNLAILTGREGDNATAIEYLKKAILLKADYRDAYWALSIFYTENKQPELARSILQDYLGSINPNDKEFQEKLGQ